MTGKDVQNLVGFLVVAPLQVLLFYGVARFTLRRLRAGKPSLTPLPIVDEGAGRYRVPLVASFGSYVGLKWIVDSSNSYNPLLIIGPDGLECRAIRRRRIAFRDIKRLEVDVMGRTVNLHFTFRNSVRTFIGNVGSLILAKEVLAMLPAGIPLGDGARALLADDAVIVRPRQRRA